MFYFFFFYRLVRFCREGWGGETEETIETFNRKFFLTYLNACCLYHDGISCIQTTFVCIHSSLHSQIDEPFVRVCVSYVHNIFMINKVFFFLTNQLSKNYVIIAIPLVYVMYNFFPFNLLYTLLSDPMRLHQSISIVVGHAAVRLEISTQ